MHWYVTCVELNAGLPLVHHDRVVSHKEIFRLVAQRQSDHVLFLGVVSGNVAPGAPQRQRWSCRHVPSIPCTNTA